MPRLTVVPKDESPDTIADLLPSFGLSLRAAARSPRTVILRTSGTRRFANWLVAQGRSTSVEAVTPDDVRGYLVSLADAHKAGNTISAEHAAIRGFYAWAIGEGIVSIDPTARVRAPRVTQRPVPILSDDDLRRLFDACSGSTFADKRDAALLRFAVDTGVRRAELVALTVEDIDLSQRIATIRRGKGGRGRTVAFSNKTAVALSRYLRLRKAHRAAASPALWLSRSRPTTYGTLRDSLARRAARAGIQGFHLHALRHAWTHRVLAAGMSEGDAMALGGWRSSRMLQTVYATALSGERAVAAAHRLNLGDKF